MNDNVHYFQRYTKKENVVTNNTLLLLKRIYSHNPIIFYRFLFELIFKDSGSNTSEEDLAVAFKNQLVSDESIPDGIIYQPSINIIIETKITNGAFYINQLERHLKTFNDSSTYQVLLALSNSDDVSNELYEKMQELIKDRNIIFKPISFERLIDVLKKHVNEYEFEIRNMIEDYFEFCKSSDLIKHTWLIARTAGGTFDDDKEGGFYHDGYGRDYDVQYFGLYRWKAINCIGKVEKIIAIKNGEFEKVVRSYDGKKELTTDQKERLNKIIKLITDKYKAFDSYVYLVDKFYDTWFAREGNYGIQSKKYFDVNKILKNLKENIDVKKLSAETLANLLKDKFWEDFENDVD